jgi:hypothetical protein
VPADTFEDEGSVAEKATEVAEDDEWDDLGVIERSIKIQAT